MTAYIDLQTRVNRRVIDLPAAVQAEVPALINDAIRSIQRKYNFRSQEATQTFTTATGVIALGSIARFKEYRDDGPYVLKQLTRSRRLLTALDTDVNIAVLSDPDLPDEPEFLLNTVDELTGQYNFILAPYPDLNSDWDDGNYRIVVPFYRYSAPLVNSTDENWFTDNADDYITYKATAEAFALDWDYDSMALWLQRAKEKQDEIIKADKVTRLSGVNELVPMWQGSRQPKVRR